MNFEFFINPLTNDKHIHDHGVSEKEIKEVFKYKNYFEKRRKDKSYIAFAKLYNGRYLKIIYRKLTKELYFIITAFDLEDQKMIDLLNREFDI